MIIVSNRGHKSWQPPTTGTIKCNIDATLLTYMYYIGVSFYLRDEWEKVLVAQIERHPWKMIALKLINCVKEIKWITSYGLTLVFYMNYK